jgi:hypothetical protein
MKRCSVCLREMSDNAPIEGYVVHPIVGHDELFPNYICTDCKLAYNKWAVERQREAGTRE